MATFSDRAVERLLDLYKNHDGQVGSKLQSNQPELYKGYKPASCIGYVKDVLVYAYQAVGRADFAKRVQQNLDKYDQMGTKLAELLVAEDGWTGVFTNPDTTYPDDEAAQATRDLDRTCKYYRIPISYKLVNYSPDTNTKLKPNEPVASIQYSRIVSVKFGFGCSDGGHHTWLYSSGDVYEVHYLSPPGPDLYERSMLSKFTKRYDFSRSGALFVPPDAFAASLLKEAVDMECTVKLRRR